MTRYIKEDGPEPILDISVYRITIGNQMFDGEVKSLWGQVSDIKKAFQADERVTLEIVKKGNERWIVVTGPVKDIDKMYKDVMREIL